MLIQCKICEKLFEANKPSRLYCSRECCHKSKIGDKRLTGRPRQSKPVNLQCAGCGKEFLAKEYDVKRGRGSYCSHDCYHKNRAGKKRGPYKWNGQCGRVPIVPEEAVCVACGQKFRVGGRYRPKYSARFCSQRCRFLARYRRAAKCLPLTSEDAAYLAGLIDGEGSVMLVMSRESVALRVSVSNTNLQILDWSVKATKIGGIYKHQRKNAKHKTGWSWRTHSEGAETLLRQLLPFLKIKKKQAEMGVQFQERLRTPSLKIEKSWQLEWMAKMKEMNRRGIRPTSAE